jgi:putative spermidine/putrescine transport system ATP-binding protein
MNAVAGNAAAQSLSLHIRGISKSFGSVVALDTLSLDLPPGELLALLGPSGCGKTTTLRIIAGFERPDTGGVSIGTRDITRIPPNRRNLGMVFQNYSLFPHMTVGENVAFGLKVAGVAKGETTERVRRILDVVRLPAYEERYPNQLSGGQQQRVALARSLINNPSVLLLDEPLGALDKSLREGMQFELRQLQRRLGITSVLVTHDQEEALTMSDRIAVMSQGRVLQVGTPTDVYDTPRTRTVAEFLGTANIFEAHVGGGAPGGRHQFRIGASDYRFEAASPRALADGDTVQIAVRPEKLLLSPKAAPGIPSIPGRIVEHVFRGSYHAYQIAAAGYASPLFAYVSSQRIGERALALGDEVFAGWDGDSAVVLEAA